MTNHIQVIINPAAGNDEPILNTLNTAFAECEVDWDVSITHKAGDAYRLAGQAVKNGADIVAVYGGDGTVTEVASALVDSTVPLAILPGGTANVMSLELGIPTDLLGAARLAGGIERQVEKIDVGQVGSHTFLLRLGIGFEAAMVEQADRALKDRLGVLAYLWSGMQNLRQPAVAHYQMVLDGKEVESAGFTCAIANSGNMGLSGITLSQAISIRDGLLDIVIIEEASWRALFDLFSHVFSPQSAAAPLKDADLQSYNQEIQGALRHWQAKEISLRMDPIQVTQYDGELLSPVHLPLTCHVRPQALHVITKAAPASTV